MKVSDQLNIVAKERQVPVKCKDEFRSGVVRNGKFLLFWVFGFSHDVPCESQIYWSCEKMSFETTSVTSLRTSCKTPKKQIKKFISDVKLKIKEIFQLLPGIELDSSAVPTVVQSVYRQVPLIIGAGTGSGPESLYFIWD